VPVFGDMLHCPAVGDRLHWIRLLAGTGIMLQGTTGPRWRIDASTAAVAKIAPAEARGSAAREGGSFPLSCRLVFPGSDQYRRKRAFIRLKPELPLNFCVFSDSYPVPSGCRSRRPVGAPNARRMLQNWLPSGGRNIGTQFPVNGEDQGVPSQKW
jgi:hypothetical protein